MSRLAGRAKGLVRPSDAVYQGKARHADCARKCVRPLPDCDPFQGRRGLAIAKGVNSGLAGFVWTNDPTRVLRFSAALEAGMIGVNSENLRHLPTPFGGGTFSGIGRGGGNLSFHFFMETKNTGIANGANAVNDQFSGIHLADGDIGINYNFAEVLSE